MRILVEFSKNWQFHTARSRYLSCLRDRVKVVMDSPFTSINVLPKILQSATNYPLTTSRVLSSHNLLNYKFMKWGFSLPYGSLTHAITSDLTAGAEWSVKSLCVCMCVRKKSRTARKGHGAESKHLVNEPKHSLRLLPNNFPVSWCYVWICS